MAPSNLGTIKALSIASFGLIIGYSIQGILNGENLAQLAFTLLAVGAVCAPAAIPVAHTPKE